ncbi:MAG: hypothetical protein GXO60_05640 [Epsilonproteobacteria bacterium]|nr:hypothetical protein [Campylobacterota bacterium]
MSYMMKMSFLLLLNTAMVLAGTIEIKSKISNRLDDAEENRASGKMYLYSQGLDLVEDKGNNHFVGLRFKNIKIPKGANIINAYLQFTSEEINSEPTNLIIYGEASKKVRKFKGKSYNISSRVKTYLSVEWSNVPAWNSRRERGDAQRSPNISSIVQEIVDMDSWKKGNAMGFIITGDGKRVAKSYDSSRTYAPILYIEYMSALPEKNHIPIANAGDDQILSFKDEGRFVYLHGDKSSDLDNDELFYKWRFLSVPEGSSLASDIFTTPNPKFYTELAGNYVLELVVSDGESSSVADTVKILITKPFNIEDSLNKDFQPSSQKSAYFVGSKRCESCHKEDYTHWHNSRHAKMIHNLKTNQSSVVGDFSNLPPNADFTLKDILYTMGGKFKQRYMIPAIINGKKDFRLGNYQWNSETHMWQSFKPYKSWYYDSYPHDNKQFSVANTCDGCHFTGYMSREKHIESTIGCETCHGPGSEHVKNPANPIYKEAINNPVRSNDVCIQCHIRNRDKRLETNETLSSLWMKAKDYPSGYEAGRPLSQYKLDAPFTLGVETSEFWANGAAKKNRTQGNEYVHDAMYIHGVTCMNCHNPHKLTNVADNSNGNESCIQCHSLGDESDGSMEERIEAHTHHKANSKGSLCIECHMPKTGKHTSQSPLTVRSHQFKFTSPLETKKFNMPKETNACYSCHKDKSLDSLQDSLDRWLKNSN